MAMATRVFEELVQVSLVLVLESTLMAQELGQKV